MVQPRGVHLDRGAGQGRPRRGESRDVRVGAVTAATENSGCFAAAAHTHPRVMPPALSAAR